VFAESDPGNAAAARIDGIQVINDGALSAVSPDDITITVDTVAGTVSAVNSRTGDPLTVTPAAYTSGESFEVAGVQATITDAGDGDEFTLRAGERQSVFATIENLIDGLDNIDKGSPAGQAAYDDLIAASLQNLDNAQESIVQKQTEIGGRLNAVDSTKSFLEDSSVYSEDIRSQLRDVDYAEAISNLSFQSFVLQAAQQSFAQVSQLSLFDRL